LYGSADSGEWECVEERNEEIRMKRLIITGLAVALCAVVSQASAQFNIYIPPQCELEVKHFLVKNAQSYIKKAVEEDEAEKRTANLQDARRVLMDALGRGEEGNPSVWYFLGRYALMVPDYAEADSAFAKVESMFPECKEDIDNHRQFAWTEVYNEAVTALQANDLEAARRALTAANTIYHQEPLVPYYLANVLANLGDTEGAMEHFKETVAFGIDTGQYADPYTTSIFNVARISHMLGNYDSAAVWYARYRVANPGDYQALTGLASVYELAGRTEDAIQVFDTILTESAAYPAIELFTVGVTLFHADEYDRAVRAFNFGLEKNPYLRDGLYNLTQSLFAIASPDPSELEAEPTPEDVQRRQEAAGGMLEAAKRLVNLDPFNTGSQRLLAAAYQLVGQEDSIIAVLQRVEGMPYEINVYAFQPSEEGNFMQGTISNLMEEQLTIPPLEFEFLDEQGQVLITEVFSGATIEAKGSAEFNFSPVAPGVAAWRYRLPTQ
jgi:tetratricopeptide (TPR) repeat protein